MRRDRQNMVDQPKLGGLTNQHITRRPEFGSGGSSARWQMKQPSTDYNGIAQGILQLMGTLVQKQEKQKEAQTEEDKLYAKSLLQQDVINIKSAIETGESVDENINKEVIRLRDMGMTNSEITASLFDSKITSSIDTLGGDISGVADSLYIRGLNEHKATMFSEYAQVDKKTMQENIKSIIYQNSLVTVGEETLDDALVANVSTAKAYGLREQDVINTTIQKAFDDDKLGQSAFIDKIKDVKYNGVNIIDTVEGRTLYNKLIQEKEDRDWAKHQREETVKRQEQSDYADTLMADTVNDLTNLTGHLNNAKEMFKAGKIDSVGYSRIENYVKATRDMWRIEADRRNATKAEKQVSDFEAFYDSQVASINGTFTPEIAKALVNAGYLTVSDAQNLLKTSATNSGEVVQYKADSNYIKNISHTSFGISYSDPSIRAELEAGMYVGKEKLAVKRAGMLSEQLTEWYHRQQVATGKRPTMIEINEQADKLATKIKTMTLEESLADKLNNMTNEERAKRIKELEAKNKGETK